MENNIINANPTKEFFISMLTRDIDIKAAILELIDNSIDGAKRIKPNGDFSGLYVKIFLDQDKFYIEDNCGGIPIEIAKNYAFRFGRSNRKEQPEQQYGSFTGIFGIGMKRALFRMGKKFKVESIALNDSFSMEVDVDKWIEDKSTDWSFELSDQKLNQNNQISTTGTKITVTNLYSGIKKDFQLTYFINMLTDHIEKYRTAAAENGLNIYINDKKIIFIKSSIIDSEVIKPFSNKKMFGNVNVTVIASVAPKGHPENAGWYVYCNGRLIVYADKTALTGWGDKDMDTPQYHPSFAVFRGFVFFDSNDLDKLPWNTTKTSVDTSSVYYIAAKQIMKEANSQILGFIKLLQEQSDFVESGDKDILSVDVEQKFLDAKSLINLDSAAIKSLSSRDSKFNYVLEEKKNIIKTATVTFRRSKEKIEQVKSVLNVRSNKEVGENCFDYYYNKEVGNDE